MTSHPKQVGKVMTEEGLAKDLLYVLRGIDCHAVLAAVCPPKRGLKILEPGCGSGKLSAWYSLRGAECTLLDIDPDALTYAQALYERAGIPVPPPFPRASPLFKLGSVLNLPLDWTNTYDFVFNEGVPHHWGSNPKDWRRQRCLNEMVRVTKPGGWVCVIGSNGHCPDTLVMTETTLHTYRSMPPHQKAWSRSELVERLIRAGLRASSVEVRPVGSNWGDAPLLAGRGQKP